MNYRRASNKRSFFFANDSDVWTCCFTFILSHLMVNISIFRFSMQLVIPCCLAVLVALTSAEAETKPAAAVTAAVNNEAEKKQDANVEPKGGSETAKNKRGLHASLGDYASFGGGHESYAYGGGDFGGHGGWDFGGHGFENHDFGASEHHHEHVKHITVEKKIPVPYTITKHVPYTVEKKVPYEVKVSQFERALVQKRYYSNDFFFVDR